ncbi:orotidine-5'-phosphate decarboxylase [Parahaliea sp. F7430]|uniref:Orotidine 5'-phosphate decarboxylase n=1 Tax=Sediminihaliea albiluteola TaxID=2758564 RepID=A0A7W2TVU5_9GAMM|nr:orotidine-5'-phosphate decarboxylase [Sediminihaliea albiluteola]MBA6412856.1 orotidine-5'-phosphate decarboxylase [Sediminihaliea albiluteola]
MTSPVLIALDYASEAAALALAEQLSPELCRLKVGKELFTRSGPQLVEKLQGMGYEIFLDLKFHDIPNTVAGAVRAAADLGVWMVNVHASGGRRMMEAAADVLQSYSQPPLLIAVTVLTSMSEADLQELGYSESPAQRVQRLAALADDSGMDGVVCSALEAPQLRAERREGFCLVTPGIRLAGDSAGDQRRVVTPAEALAKGSDYLVIGRSVTAAAEPLKALKQVQAEIA